MNNNNNPDQPVVTEQRLLRAMTTQKELFDEKLGRVQGTLESRMLYLSQMIQWVAIMALAVIVLMALGGILITVNKNGAALEGGRVIIEQPIPGDALKLHQAPLQ